MYCRLSQDIQYGCVLRTPNCWQFTLHGKRLLPHPMSSQLQNMGPFQKSKPCFCGARGHLKVAYFSNPSLCLPNQISWCTQIGNWLSTKLAICENNCDAWFKPTHEGWVQTAMEPWVGLSEKNLYKNIWYGYANLEFWQILFLCKLSRTFSLSLPFYEVYCWHFIFITHVTMRGRFWQGLSAMIDLYILWHLWSLPILLNLRFS